MILQKMEKGAVLKEDIAYDYRLMVGGQPPTYERLRDRMEAYVLRTELQSNREKQERELQGRNAAPAKTTRTQKTNEENKKIRRGEDDENPQKEPPAVPAPKPKGEGKGNRHCGGSFLL